MSTASRPLRRRGPWMAAGGLLLTSLVAGCGTPPPKPTPRPTPATPPPTPLAVAPNCSEPYSGPLTKGIINGTAYVTGAPAESQDMGAEVGLFAAGQNKATSTTTTDGVGDFTFTVPPGAYEVGILASSGTTPLVAVDVSAHCNSNVVVTINVAQTTPLTSPTASGGASAAAGSTATATAAP